MSRRRPRTAEQNEELRRRAVEMFEAGVSRPKIARALCVGRYFVEKAVEICEPQPRNYKVKDVLKNPWLEPTDEANLHGNWVPSPDEIAASCLAIRQAKGEAWPVEDERMSA